MPCFALCPGLSAVPSPPTSRYVLKDDNSICSMYPDSTYGRLKIRRLMTKKESRRTNGSASVWSMRRALDGKDPVYRIAA